VTTGRTRCPCSLRRWSAAGSSLGSRVRIPLRSWMFITCVCCVGSSDCDELVTHSEGTYVIWTHLTAVSKVKIRYVGCYPYSTNRSSLPCCYVVQSYVIIDRVSVTLWMPTTFFSKIENRVFQKRIPVSSPVILAPITIPKTRKEEILTT
jgi:hypothetical protein